MVLGVKWLASLNTIQANWNEMFHIFSVNSKKYKLQGVPQPQEEKSKASLHSLVLMEGSLRDKEYNVGNNHKPAQPTNPPS